MAACAATALLATMATTSVFAIDGTSAANTTGETTVKYEVTEGYTWSVPATIDFGKDLGAENKTKEVSANADTGDSTEAPQKVKVTKNVIGEGKALDISISNNQVFTITRKDSKTTLNYTVTKAGASGALAAGGNILTVDAGNNSDSVALTFKLTTTSGTAEIAGTYEGTLSYMASIKDQTND